MGEAVVAAQSSPLGVATTDRNSDVTEKLGYHEIALGFIQRYRLGVVTSSFQNDCAKTAATNLRLQMPQNLSRDAATSGTCSHKHALNFNGLPIDSPEPTTADGLIGFSCDYKISAGLFEFGDIDSFDRRSRIKRGNLSVQFTDQPERFIRGGTHRYDCHA